MQEEKALPLGRPALQPAVRDLEELQAERQQLEPTAAHTRGTANTDRSKGAATKCNMPIVKIVVGDGKPSVAPPDNDGPFRRQAVGKR
jgi:hypothetical protein